MKTWSDIAKQDYLYLVNTIETIGDNDKEVILPKYTKLRFEYLEENELMFIVAEGEHKGFDLYFYTDRNKPEDLLFRDECLILKGAISENEPEEINALRWVVEQFELVLEDEKAGSVAESLSFAKSVLQKHLKR